MLIRIHIAWVFSRLGLGQNHHEVLASPRILQSQAVYKRASRYKMIGFEISIFSAGLYPPLPLLMH
jgi:hypothetical protein